MLIPSKHSGYQAGIRLYPGKRGSSTPAPDPALIAAQIKSMGIQDDVIQRIMANSDDMAPLQKAQMQFGLDSSKTAYQQSQEDREWALGKRDKLSGIQDKIAEDATAFDEEGRRRELAGEAGSDINQAFSSAAAQQQRQQQRMGVNPSSGAALAASNQAATSKALALAQAGTAAGRQAKAEGYALADRANNTLAGYPASVGSSAVTGAGLGASGLTMANAGLAGLNSGFSAAGGQAGAMGQNATGMFNAQANYKNNQDQLAAQSDPWAAVGGAVMKFAMSDVNAKRKFTGLRPGEALEKVASIPVSEWQYKGDSAADDGGKRHVGPMAQDVQRALGDDVAPDGKAIDLVSMNGVAMAAIQDLNRKVDLLAGARGLRRQA